MIRDVRDDRRGQSIGGEVVEQTGELPVILPLVISADLQVHQVVHFLEIPENRFVAAFAGTEGPRGIVTLAGTIERDAGAPESQGPNQTAGRYGNSGSA